MHLLNWPNELLQIAAENLQTQKDINAFTQTNRRLYNLLNDYLYRHNVRQFGSSALLWAAKHGQEATAQKLLDGGANIQAKDEDGQTPLSWAARNGHEAVVKLLLAEDSVDPDSKDDGQTPLSLAAEQGHHFNTTTSPIFFSIYSR